jgi:tRNA pseudouridine55 synthase
LTARQPREQVDGVVLVDKPGGITSQTAVSIAKRLLNARKAGHTGTLDPMAGGLLPVCFGEATKFAQLLLDAGKSYDATVKLGVTTTTGDMEGEVVRSIPAVVEREAVAAALGRFRGAIEQVPPMHSALKHAGKPLYEYARAGVDVERKARAVNITRLELVSLQGDELRIAVSCSKGTYIRVLAAEIGEALGCGACLAGLTRTAAGPFQLAQAVGLDALEGMTAQERVARLLPPDVLVGSLTRVDLDADDARRLSRGQTVELKTEGMAGMVRLYGPGASFMGVGEVVAPRSLRPKRLLVTFPAQMPGQAGGTAGQQRMLEKTGI